MIELTHTAYASLDVDDPKYLDSPRYIRADVLKALALISATHRQLFGFKYGVPSVTVYKSKKKVFIKYRWPQNYNEGDDVYDVLNKDVIYETVLGMIMS